MAKIKTNRKGLIACRGRVEGKVFIINNPIKPPRTKGGEIIVVPFSTPVLTMVLAKASGLITDTGGINSHTAVIAREFNIPCLVGTSNATKILKNGQKIILDAHKGIIYEK